MSEQHVKKDFKSYQLLIRNLRNEYEKSYNTKASNTLRERKKAKIIEFSPTITILTSNENTVGKSTVVKMILWVLGCEPKFKDSWDIKSLQACLDIQIGRKLITIYRQYDFIAIKEGSKKWKRWEHITGGYSEYIANLVGFHVQLDDRNKTNSISTPPPAFYFLPFYIDQSTGWTEAWVGFENLGQYANWKKEIIRNHVGLIPASYYVCKQEAYKCKNQVIEIENDINEIEQGIRIINRFVDAPNILVPTSESLEQLKIQISNDLYLLQKEEEKLLEEYSECIREKTVLSNQLKLLSSHIEEFINDYSFSVNIVKDEFDCPLCGTHFHNDLLSRSSILKEKQKAESNIENINAQLTIIEEKITRIASNLDKVKQQIINIENKVICDSNEQKISVQELLRNVANSMLVENATKEKESRKTEYLLKLEEVKRKEKELKNCITKERKKELLDYYINQLNYILKSLLLDPIEASTIKDFQCVSNRIGGGAADDIRVIIAYYLAIYKTIVEYGNEVIAPYIIDSPNQQEQSKINYSKILSLISESIPTGAQLILCAMRNDIINDFINTHDVKTIELTYKNHLLRGDEYAQVKDSINMKLFEIQQY